MSKSLSKILRILEELRKLDPEMQLQMAAVFILVARKQGITMKEIEENLDISQASCSRNIAALSKWHRLNKPGHDLVYATEDPAEKRRKIIFLTPKGKRVATSLSYLLDPADD